MTQETGIAKPPSSSNGPNDERANVGQAATTSQLEMPCEPGHPLSGWTDASWDEISHRVKSACRAYLAAFPSLDPNDTAQDVLVQLLRKDFGKKFDPRIGDIWGYIGGVVSKGCRRAMMAAMKHPRGRGHSAFDTLVDRNDPVVEASCREFLDGLDSASEALSIRELQALAVIRDRAAGSTSAYSDSGIVSYVDAFRCRARLRQLLRRHGDATQ